MRTPLWLSRMPVVPRAATAAGLIGATLGGLVGLTFGLRADAATAWFAVLELAVPVGLLATIIGAVVSLAVLGSRVRSA